MSNLINAPEKYTFNIDDALDVVNLSFAGYTPSSDALEFWNIARLIKGEDFEVDNPLLHYWMIDLVFGNIKREDYPYSEEINSKIKINNRKVALMLSRGLAKSTTLTLFLPLYIAIKGSMPSLGKVGFILGIGDSQEGSAKVMANTIRDTCEESAFCKDYFENMRFTDQHCEFLRKGTGPESKRSMMFQVKGAQGGIRGIRHKGARVDLIVADDIVKNESDAASTTIMNAIKNTIYSDAINALKGQGGKVILIGTPMNKVDVVYSAVESGSWTPIVIPICQNISSDLKEADFIGSWPQMHSYERVMERYADAVGSGSTRSFNQELMLRISSEEDRMIQDGMIQWVDRKDIEKRLGNFKVVITTDFTTTSEANSDFSVLLVWAISSNEDYFLIDMCVRRQSIGQQYSELFRMLRYWGNKTSLGIEVGVEIDGNQTAHIFALKQMMIKENVFFTFARQKGAPLGREGILSRAGGSKHERFRLMMPLLQNHKFFFSNELKETPDMVEALNELRYVSYTGFLSKHDDFCDGLSQLGSMQIYLPMKGDSLTLVTKKHQMWGFEDKYEEEPNAYDGY